MYRLNITYKQFYVTLNEKVTQMPPVHAANLVANSGNTAYGVDVITWQGTRIVAPTTASCYFFYQETTGCAHLYSTRKQERTLSNVCVIN